MRVDIPIEQAFRADEIRRIGLAIRYANQRSRLRRLLLEELDRELPDYHRPTKEMREKRKKTSIIKLLKYLLP